MTADMSIDLTLRLAEKRVNDFAAQNDVIARHYEAMKCRDCEEFLAAGIEAFTLIDRADATFRQAAVEGLDVPADARDALGKLFRHWLSSCQQAEDLIEEQLRANFEIDNLLQFRDACKAVRQRVLMLDMNDAMEQAQQGEFFDDAFWQQAADLRAPR